MENQHKVPRDKSDVPLFVARPIPLKSKVVSDIPPRPSQMSMASEEGGGSSKSKSSGAGGKRKAFNFPAVKRPR